MRNMYPQTRVDLARARAEATKKAKRKAAIANTLIGTTGFVVIVVVAGWLMLVGGMEQLVNAVEANPVSGSGIAWGAVRVAFAGFVATLIAFGTFGVCLAVNEALVGRRRR